MVDIKPLSSEVLGCQPSAAVIFLMSGQRLTGSSIGSGDISIFESDPVRSSTIEASSIIATSSGLPRLKGPATSAFGCAPVYRALGREIVMIFRYLAW